MKLYATTTSERASKGQGGNEYLDILVEDYKKLMLEKKFERLSFEIRDMLNEGKAVNKKKKEEYDKLKRILKGVKGQIKTGRHYA